MSINELIDPHLLRFFFGVSSSEEELDDDPLSLSELEPESELDPVLESVSELLSDESSLESESLDDELESESLLESDVESFL